MNRLKFLSNHITKIIFAFSVVFIFCNINLNYLSTRSPDFEWYKDYIDYFYNIRSDTNREQGIIYFYLVSLMIKLSAGFYGPGYIEQVFSNSIQNTNLLILIFGLIGFYKFLLLKEFKTSQIYLAFSALVFFPQTINLLLTMKPEIFAFSCLTWSLFFIEKYLLNYELKYLILFTIPTVFILTSKATIIAMTGILFLSLVFYNKFNFFTFNSLVGLSVLASLFLIISYENYIANQMTIFDHLVTNPEMMQTADLSFLYKINFRELYADPFRHTHANSLIDIILLDTFGDYFRWYAYHDESAFNYIKENINSIWYITHWREFFSIIFTAIFYFLILYFANLDNKIRIYLLTPFIGIFVLLAQAFGFPQKNFNKETAELFKSHYYSFFLVFAFTLIFLLIAKKNKYLGIFTMVLIIVNSIFLYGFPTSNEQYNNLYIIEKSKFVTTCKINSLFLKNLNNSDCFNYSNLTCDFYYPLSTLRDENIKELEKNSNNLFKIENNFELVSPNSEIYITNNKDECDELIKNGYKFYSPYNTKLKTPIFSIFLLMLFIALAFKETLKRDL